MSRTHKGHVSAVKCRRIFALSSGTPPFSNISFCPSWPVCHLREHLYMCSSNPSHTLTCICHLLNFSSASLTSLMFSPSSLFCYYGVCLPLPLCFKWGNTALYYASCYGHTATVELLLRAGADTEAKDRVRERKNYTLTCDSQNGLKVVAPCGLSSPRWS